MKSLASRAVERKGIGADEIGHQATPVSRYTPSARPYRGFEESDYPFHNWTAVVTQ